MLKAEIEEQNKELIKQVDELQLQLKEANDPRWIKIDSYEWNNSEARRLEYESLKARNIQLTDTNNELVRAMAVEKGSITAKLTDVIHNLTVNK